MNNTQNHWSTTFPFHYNDDILGAVASQITSLTIVYSVYSTVDSDADQRKHHSSASLAFVRGIHRGPLISPHKWPVTQKMIPFHDVIIFLIKMDDLFPRRLTHWCRNKMAAVSQTTFLNAFLMKMYVFYQNFTEVCSLGSNQQYSSTGSGNGLAPIIWTKDG